MKVHVIPCLSDNYAYLVEGGSGAVVVDPSEAGPVARAASALGLTITHILITHYHHDHTGGVGELKRRFGAEAIGPEPAGMGVDRVGRPGEHLDLHGLTVEVVDTPGHAFPHVAYHAGEEGWLFSGDCLFGAGCGRLAGNKAEVMWNSLQALAARPDETRVFFGHEYTLSNLSFAASVEPENPAIEIRRRHEEEILRRGGYSAPSTLAGEKQTNPFLRTGSTAIRNRLGMITEPDVKVFAALREAKNRFSG